MTLPPGPLEVLVVDDSAVVRQLVVKMLAPALDIHVTVAADPIFALAKMQRTRPHVIVLDLEMPRMGGLSFLRKIMIEDPIPVIVWSALVDRDTVAARRALEEGALEVLPKPVSGLRDLSAASAALLVEKIRAASRARLTRRSIAPSLPCKPPDRPDGAPAPGNPLVIAMGASTGGTQALRMILSRLPRDSPGVLMVQHMPAGFTKAFARDLDRTSALQVREARDGDVVEPGVALLAPGDRHLTLDATSGRLLARLDDGPRVSRHRPSVDVLFGSVARTSGLRAIGVLLTGMGADGAEGLLAMRRAGARTIAQDEASSVVFGMPGEAIARGAAERVVALPHVAPTVIRMVGEPSVARRVRPA